MPTKPDCNLTFSIANSGKKLVSLGLKTPNGMDIMRKLLSETDIFVSNTRYGGLPRLGLDYETLHKTHPHLICCYVNGYGFELYDRMIEAFAQKTTDEWVQIFTELDVSFEVLAGNWEVSKDPQVWANGCLNYMECPNGSTYSVPTTPVDFAGAERTPTRHAGTIGCDTKEVLASLGYTPEQIEDYLQRGVAVVK